MIIIEVNGAEYKKCFQSVTWRGGVGGAFRKLDFEIEALYCNFLVGDKVAFRLDDTKTLFKGRIILIDRNANSNIITVSAADDGLYLLRNHFVKNYYNKVPSEIVKEICSELKLEVGRLPQDKVKCTFPAIDRTAYEIILMAYTIQHNKDGKIYSIACNDGKIEVLDENVMLEFEIKSGYNIKNANYKTSIEKMINQVVVYKDGKIIDKVANEEDKNKYGLFQDVLSYSEDLNNIIVAKDNLRRLDEKATIEVDGNVDLQAGYTVAIQETRTGLYGTFLIIEDTHTWTDGEYKTRIALAFENSMDKIAIEKERNKREKKSKSYLIKDKRVLEKLEKEKENQK